MFASDLGNVAILLAFVVAIYGLAASIAGAQQRLPSLVASAANGLVALAGLLTVAAVVLVRAFLTHDFGVRYVAENSSLDQPWYYTLSAFYGSQAGSLLFWAWTLSLFSVAMLLTTGRRYRHLAPYAMATLFGIQVFFLLTLGFVTSPFERLPVPPPDGRGLNPLLKDPGMLVHPPMLLMGYMSFSIPFALAMAALLTGKLDDWIYAARRWTVAAWAIQGTGLLLGAWWAYHVLGWGGYWGWDPVENAAFLPWLTATALLHSIMVQERRGMLRVWNLVLIIATFSLAVFGTFIVRSGIITSVHSFSQSPIGPFFFAFLAIVLLLSIGLLLHRLPLLRSDQAFDSMLSREASFLVNNLLLVGLTFAVFWGTIFPIVSEAAGGTKITVGPPFYGKVAGPLLLGLMGLMGFGPLLAWRRTSESTLRRSIRWPIGFAVGGLLLGLLLGARDVLALIALIATGFALGTIVYEFDRGVWIRRKNTGEPLLVALSALVGRNRRRYGGYLVHLAVVCLGLGIIGSAFFQIEREVALGRGESVTVGRYALTNEGIFQREEPGVRYVSARLAVRSDFERFTLWPEKQFHRGWEQQATTGVALRTTLPRFEDLYVYLGGWEAADGTAVLHVFVNPLVSLVWVGGAMFLVGTFVSLWPAGRPAPARRRSPSALGSEGAA